MKVFSSFEPDSFYHVINHAVGIENLFHSADNYVYFLKRYTQYMPSVCDTYAYCLMPNHIHFLVKTYPEKELKDHPKFKGNFHKLVMQELSNLLNAYAKAFNKMYNRKGSLWLNSTKRIKLSTLPYLVEVIEYIHQNPIHHGFCEKAEDWKYSSYNKLFSESPTLLNREAVIRYFGGLEKYLEYHRQNALPLIEEYEY